MNNADEIRKQIQAAKDQIISTVSCTTDYQMLVDTRMLERLVNDLTNLERQLIEMERVILKPGPSYDSLQDGQVYYVRFKRGEELVLSEFYSASDDGSVRSRAINVSDLDQIFIRSCAGDSGIHAGEAERIRCKPDVSFPHSFLCVFC